MDKLKALKIQAPTSFSSELMHLVESWKHEMADGVVLALLQKSIDIAEETER